MRTVNVGEAKTQLSALIDQAERGVEVVIARAGRPAVRLVPVRPAERPLGLDRGRFTVPEGFDDPLPEALLAAFEGEAPRKRRRSR